MAEVVIGRVGGLLSELEDVVPRAVEVAVLEVVVEDEVGRFAVVVLDTGRLVVADVPVLALTGVSGLFSLDASGLDLLASSPPPESTVESTGVAGGAFSTSTPGDAGTGSSVDAILFNWRNQGMWRVVSGQKTTVADKVNCSEKGA